MHLDDSPERIERVVASRYKHVSMQQQPMEREPHHLLFPCE
jgi:hypothetical protein